MILWDRGVTWCFLQLLASLFMDSWQWIFIWHGMIRHIIFSTIIIIYVMFHILSNLWVRGGYLIQDIQKPYHMYISFIQLKYINTISVYIILFFRAQNLFWCLHKFSLWMQKESRQHWQQLMSNFSKLLLIIGQMIWIYQPGKLLKWGHIL